MEANIARQVTSLAQKRQFFPCCLLVSAVSNFKAQPRCCVQPHQQNSKEVHKNEEMKRQERESWLLHGRPPSILSWQQPSIIFYDKRDISE